MHKGMMLALMLVAGCSRAAQQAPPSHDGHAPAPAAQPEAEHADMSMERVRHNRQFLVSTESLAVRLNRPGTTIIHVGRSDSAYLAAHIPGARFVPLSALMTGGPVTAFPSVRELQRLFESLQMGDSNRVVIYGDDLGLLAARAWIALDILGQADRSALLDGGLQKWRAENRPTESGQAMHTMQFVPFTPRPRDDVVVDAEWVRRRLGDSTIVLVDARPAAQYTGAEDPPCAPGNRGCRPIPAARRGHIPMARNLFWQNALVSAENPVLRPMHQLHHALWQPTGADLPSTRTVVTYCRSGLQSGHAYFVARYVGYPDVRIYEGSFADWAARNARRFPVVRL